MTRRILKAIGITLCYLAVWAIAAAAVGRVFILPSPLDTLKAIFALAQTKDFYLSILITFLRVLGGFAAGMIIGSLLGALTAVSSVADELLAPLRSIIKATPVTSFIILVLLYLTSSLTPAFIAFLVVVPIFWANVRAGIRAVDPLLVEMARTFHVPPLRRLTKLYAPGTASQFVAACMTGLGFAWKSGVAAEVIANSRYSIGQSLFESKLYLETPELFAWTAAVVLLSIALERVMLRLLRRFTLDRT